MMRGIKVTGLIFLFAFMFGTSNAGFFINNNPLPRYNKELSSVLNQAVERIQSLENMNVNEESYRMYVDKYVKDASDAIEMLRINFSMQYTAYRNDIFMVAAKAQKQLRTWFEQIFPGRKCVLTDALVSSANVVLSSGGPAMSLGGAFGYHTFQPYGGVVGIPVRTPLAEFNSPLFSFALGKK